MKKTTINGELFSVFNSEDIGPYIEDRSVAIEECGIVYPVIPKTQSFEKDSIGVYRDGDLYVFKDPEKDDIIESYRINNLRVIDFNDVKSMKEQIIKNQELKEMESSTLMSEDNYFLPKVKDDDSPEMQALKEAVQAKKIDLSKYEKRFGDNFNNDKRLFEKSNITLSKIRTIAEALDMDCTIAFKDKEPGVPNPMGVVIEKKITNIGEEEN